MSSPDHPEQEASAGASVNSTEKFSPSNFFTESYDKGVVNAIKDHPLEAAAVAALAAGAAVSFEGGAGADRTVRTRDD